MAKQLYGRNYADMSEKYRSKHTKAEFKEARRAQRMAGEALDEGTPAADEAGDAVRKAGKGGAYAEGQQHYNPDRELVDTGAPDTANVAGDNNPYTVGAIEDFDLAAGGAGSKTGTNRLSAQDMKRLHKQGGFSKEDIVNYAETNDFGDGPGASGGKAQKLLAKYKADIAGKPVEETPVDTTPEPTPEPTPEEPAPAAPPSVNIDFGDGGVNTGGEDPIVTTQPTTALPPTPAPDQVVNQDNDQQSSIVGDNNTVSQDQDNSVSNDSSSRMGSFVKPRVPSSFEAFGMDGGYGGSQIVNQDNDQQSSIVGDGNTVNQNQNNSVSNWKNRWMTDYFA